MMNPTSARRLLVLLSPLLLAQALPAPPPPKTAAAAQNASKFEKEILAYEALDKVTPPPEAPILFVGSSTFTRWKELPADLPGLPVLNRGFGGSTMLDLNAYIDRMVLRYRPSQIVVYEGNNDIASSERTPEAVVEAMKAFHVRVHAALPETQIHFLSIIPAPSRVRHTAAMDRANALLRAYIGEHRELHYIDARNLWSDEKGQPDPKLYVADRLHPTRAAYEKLIPILRAALAPAGTRPGK